MWSLSKKKNYLSLRHTVITKQFQLHLGYIPVKPTVPINSDRGEVRPDEDMYKISVMLVRSFYLKVPQ